MLYSNIETAASLLVSCSRSLHFLTLYRSCRQTVNNLVAEAAIHDNGRDDRQNNCSKHLGIIRVIGTYEFRQRHRKRLLRIIRDEDHRKEQLIPVADKGHQTGYEETRPCQREGNLDKNLVDTIDPRLHGKPLTGNLKGIWRYRVGDYRLFAEIRDNELIIFLFEVAHRREIYK